MYHYLFTNDLRISSLDKSLKKAGDCFVTNTVPSSAENKSANNNMKTLGFYFNLTNKSNCAKEAQKGNVRGVVLNFIKKFQFPNLRTKDIYEQCIKDGIQLAPMRMIIKLLYTMNLLYGANIAWLCKKEIRLFIFYNSAVSKIKTVDLIGLINDILQYRKTGDLPKTVDNNESNHHWKQEDRQLREMIKVLLWSGCVSEEDDKIFISNNALSTANKADIYDIINYNLYWDGEDIDSYQEYMDMEEMINMENNDNLLDFNTGYQSEFSRNRIIFGAPGTGKSYRLNQDKDILLGKDSLDYERVTFHPSYSYANFVGTYKPVSKKGENGVNEIVYEYVPGPFMRIYVKALENSKDKNNIKPFLLLIEEINRANVAAVFGEVFQLLDRNSDNVSEYSIHATEDMKQYLAEQLQGNPEDFAEIKIPDNMFIWATMNSADQGVLPMDTAFKRRWDFEYISVDDEEQVAVIQDYEIPICIDNTYYVKWQELRDGINTILKAEKVNEDKLLGPFFISRTMLENINMVKETRNKIDAGEISESEVIADISNKEKTFIKAFESKVIMYLFEDVMKMRPGKIFIGYDKNKGNMIFSEICQAFEKYGEKIFDLQLKNND